MYNKEFIKMDISNFQKRDLLSQKVQKLKILYNFPKSKIYRIFRKSYNML